ncbi:hypothetical protein M5C72_02300 [Companilactobacillus allii]|uniref:Uncharacterized protein n=1 Tax=Companilactobacillus allii TaxID=1847728 RepID=A0A1P8Q288_9LACO|nr:hypothetical protein [Companilactobacillus allii]APX71994.1 hypothetical protein BTM29_05220 [Companilactobacillus allii]USQ69088.1 hypothetical protein M5C72_02300 [Companilactobacillus allii]
MRRKKGIVFVTLLFTLLTVVFFVNETRSVSADDTEIGYYKKPTGDVRKFLGIWLTSGYNLQPSTDNYVQVNNTVTLHTDSGRSVWDRAISLNGFSHYKWYQSTDGQKWSKVPDKENGDRKHMPVTPTTTGTVYYQQRVAWYYLFEVLTSPVVYSQVAAVHSLPDPVNATDVEVTTDDDYLYNSDNDVTDTTTYAHADITPANFTGTLSWSIDDTNLATIDEDTGLITANTLRKSGTVTVTATLTNPDGTITTGDTKVQIGGGLDDQTVKAGKTATFSLRGNIGELDEDDTSYSVKWYKEDPITHYRTQLDVDSKALSITTPETTLDDDGTLYLAIIQVKMGTTSMSYTTNDAFLYVTPEGGPDINIDDTLENETFNDNTNTDTMLYGVINGDKVTYHNTITNDSQTGTLSDGKYVLPLHSDTEVTKVTLDGTELSSDEYEVTENDTTKEINLIISDLNFKNNQSHSIDVETVVGGITKKETTQTIPYITGKDDDGDSYQKIGKVESISYSTDMIEQSINDIDYGEVVSYGQEALVYRSDDLNWPNNLIEIDDMRRYKNPVTVSVSQGADLENEKGQTLSGNLRYYDDDGKYTDLLSSSAVVKSTAENEQLESIGWYKNNGLVLYLNGASSAGVYTTQLNWEISDTI